MMRKLVLLLICLTGCFPLCAEEITNSLSRMVARAPQATPDAAARLAQVSHCLQGRSFCTVLTWVQAADYYNQAVQTMKQRKAKIQTYQATITPLANALKPSRKTYTPEEEQKALRKLVNHKFIFIGETHFQGVRQGVKRILSTIRTQNPSKRILLASEMAVTYAPTNALPFQKAGTHNEDIRPNNDESRFLLETVQQLNMDLLALDDRWLEQVYAPNGELIYPIKLGNYLIEVGDSNSQAHQIANSRYGYDVSAQPVLTIYALHDFFGGSWWGIEERNRQWTNYLKTIRDNYDIVVVYGGDGHFKTLDNVIASVPQRLGLKNYAHISVSKVPSPAEKAKMEERLRNTGSSPEITTEVNPYISYGKAPSVSALPVSVKRQNASLIRRAEELEKELGFYQDASLNIRIVLPQ